MNPAVFLDRDGVINQLVLNSVTGEYEPPHSAEELILFPWVIPSLAILQDAGFNLFLVSNQPDFAKGKTSLEKIRSVHERLDCILKSEGISFSDYYYCYHHPDGIVPEYSFSCECRKPKPYFLLKAALDFGIDLSVSWMIGDRDTDIFCGKSAGTKTILVIEPHSARYHRSGSSDYRAENLEEAVRIIVRTSGK